VSQQYFAEHPGPGRRPGLVHVLVPGVQLALATDAGVFSPRRLDPGSRLLLDVAPPPPESGPLLDLGCGYGPLALTMAAKSPAASVWAVDVNERALELCESNARQAGLANVHCARPDDARLPAEFGLIWSNPPIRIGKDRLHELLSRWLARLADGAAAYLVLQRHLGADSLQRWLAGSGWQADRVAARAGYRVLRASR
jgi:16S rRNA (guanine1207-N2)-methyltransferase